MEADWGTSCFDGDQDFVQSYAHFETPESIDEEDDEYDDIDDTDVLISSRKGVFQKRKQASRHQSGMGAARKKRKRKKTGAEHFYEIVLRWKPQLLHERRLLNLAPLGKSDVVYSTPQHYYNALQILPIEESRLSLLRGMQMPDHSFLLTVSSREDLTQSSFCNVTGLCTLDFTLDRATADLVRPGWVYFLFPCPPDPASPAVTVPVPPLATQLEADMCQWEDSALVATLCLSGGRGSGGTGNIQSFWVHNASLAGLQTPLRSPSSFPSRWRAYGIENVISYQRMIAACHERPRPPFISGLLGHKLPVHIKFDQDEEQGGGGGEMCVNGTDAGDRKSDSGSSSSECDGESDSSSCSSDSESEGGRGDKDGDPGLLLPLDGSQEQAMADIVGPCMDGLLAQPGGLHLVQGPPGMVSLLIVWTHQDKWNESNRVILYW